MNLWMNKWCITWQWVQIQAILAQARDGTTTSVNFLLKVQPLELYLIKHLFRMDDSGKGRKASFHDHSAADTFWNPTDLFLILSHPNISSQVSTIPCAQSPAVAQMFTATVQGFQTFCQPDATRYLLWAATHCILLSGCKLQKVLSLVSCQISSPEVWIFIWNHSPKLSWKSPWK